MVEYKEEETITAIKCNNSKYDDDDDDNNNRQNQSIKLTFPVQKHLQRSRKQPQSGFHQQKHSSPKKKALKREMDAIKTATTTTMTTDDKNEESIDFGPKQSQRPRKKVHNH
jgi:hypothetical protein